MPCIPYAPDNYLKIMISALGQGAHLNIALAKQRIHGNNTYTDRPDHPVKRRLASLYISIEIKKRWPQLGNFAKKKASRTIADIWFNRPVLGKEADLIKTFFLASSFSERLEVRLRSTIILLKQIVRKFLQA